MKKFTLFLVFLIVAMTAFSQATKSTLITVQKATDKFGANLKAGDHIYCVANGTEYILKTSQGYNSTAATLVASGSANYGLFLSSTTTNSYYVDTATAQNVRGCKSFIDSIGLGSYTHYVITDNTTQPIFWGSSNVTAMGYGVAYKPWIYNKSAHKKMVNFVVIGSASASGQTIYDNAFNSGTIIGYGSGPSKGATLSTHISSEGMGGADKTYGCVSLGARAGGGTSHTDSISNSMYIGTYAGSQSAGLKSNELWIGNNLRANTDDSTKTMIHGYMSPTGTANRMELNAKTKVNGTLYVTGLTVFDALPSYAIACGTLTIPTAATGNDTTGVAVSGITTGSVCVASYGPRTKAAATVASDTAASAFCIAAGWLTVAGKHGRAVNYWIPKK